MADKDKNKPEGKQVNIRGGRGHIVGDFNQVVQNFLADPHLRWYLLGLAVLIAAVGIGLYFAVRQTPRQTVEAIKTALPTAAPTSTPQPPTITPRPSPTAYMTNNINIAVAPLAVQGAQPDSDLGLKIARVIYSNLNTQLAELAQSGLLDKNYGLWGPEQIEMVVGETREEQAQAAGEIARAHAIHILVYGTVTIVSDTEYTVTPDFYVNDRELREIDEMTGANSLGSAFDLRGVPDSATFNTRLANALSPRVRLLTTAVRGLTYFVTYDYKNALDVIQKVAPLEVAGGNSQEGLEFLYLLAGNAAGKDRQYDLAAQYYDASFAVHPRQPYARALIGKAAMLFMQAVKPWQSTRLEDIDYDLLAESTRIYEQAVAAPNKPLSGDVDVKAAFGIGQNYFYRWYGQKEEFADPAVDNFNKMIQAYENGDDSTRLRLWGLTAYAHGYLGLIYQLAGDPQTSAVELKAAIQLLEDNDLDQDGREKLDFYRELLSKVTPTP